MSDDRDHGRIKRLGGIASGALVATTILLLCGLSLHRIWAVDYWWQWKTGEHVVDHGVPRTDVFSYTNPEHERIELRWGYCLGLHELSRWLGRPAAVFVKCAAVLAMFTVAASIATRRATIVATCLAVTVAAMAASQRFMVRPEVISYLLFAAFLAAVETARRRRTRWVFALPALQLVWVNCHGLFALGPAVVGLWLVTELIDCAFARWRDAPDPDRRRRLATAALTLAATVVACLANPYGVRAAVLPLTHLTALHGTAQKELLAELGSTFTFTSDYTALRYFKVLIVLTVGSALLNLRRQQLFWVLLVGSQLYLALTAIRNIPLFALAAVPFVIRNLDESDLLRRPSMRSVMPAARVAIGLAVAVFSLHQVRELYTNRFALRQGDTNQSGVDIARNRYPRRAVAFLETTGVRGPVFNSPGIGSYLLARDFEVFIDPRGEVYQETIIDAYLGLVRDPQRLAEYESTYGLRVFVLDTALVGLIARLHADPGWRLVHADAVATIYLRSGVAPDVPSLDLVGGGEVWLDETLEAMGPAVEYETRGPLTRLTAPNPYARLGRLCCQLAAYRPAQAMLEQARAAYPPSFAEHALLASAATFNRDYETASRHFPPALAADPDNLPLRRIAARAHWQAQRYDLVLETLEPVIRAAPEDAELLTLVGVALFNEGSYVRAAAWLQRGIRVEPTRPDLHYTLAQSMLFLERHDEAIAELEETIRLDPSHFRAARDLTSVNVYLGRVEEARRWLQRASTLEPQDPQLQQLRRQLEE